MLWGGGDYLLKPKQSPNCFQIHEETSLKHRPHTSLLPCLPFHLRLAPLTIVVNSTFLIVLAFVLQPACHHTIGSSFLSRGKPQVLGKCYTQTFQFGIKYKYLDMSSPFFTFFWFFYGIYHFPLKTSATDYQRQLGFKSKLISRYCPDKSWWKQSKKRNVSVWTLCLLNVYFQIVFLHCCTT